MTNTKKSKTGNDTKKIDGALDENICFKASLAKYKEIKHAAV